MIQEIKGDIFQYSPQAIIGQNNCFHKMGAGFAKEVKDWFPEAFEADLKTYYGDENKLGTFSVAKIENSSIKYIYNLYSQFRYGRDKRYTSYDAFANGMELIKQDLYQKGLNLVGVPYGIGAGLSGGNWGIIRAILNSVFEKEENLTLVICKKDW
jgi:O-acetyl-ADP-ribose deacetylase (regulator of RNase III)